MIKLIIDKVLRITKNRKKLEAELDVRIENRGREIFISGSAENEYIGEKVVEALDFGFPFSIALLIKEHDFILEILNIKDYTKRKDFSRIKARIIGRGGKTLSTLNHLTSCHFEVKDNFIGIIGGPEYMRNAQEAVTMIIHGSKQSNVYSHLEKNQIKSIDDLGLKE